MKHIKIYEELKYPCQFAKEFIDVIEKKAECDDSHGIWDERLNKYVTNTGNLDYIKKYLEKVDINCIVDKYDRRYTALTRAIELSDYPKYCYAEKIALFLINNGADVNLATNYGTTPLMLATMIGRNDIVKKLIQKGAIIDKQNIYGETAFIYGINSRYGIQQDEIGQLIKAGADWFLANKQDEYPWKLLLQKCSPYYMKEVFAKLYPEEYNNALSIANAKKYNL